MSTEVKIEDLRGGDTVDVLLRGLKFCHIDSDGDPWFYTVDGSTWCLAKSWPTDAVITRRDPPIEAGDRVACGPYKATVRSVDRDEAWVEWDDGPNGWNPLVLLRNLTLISKGPAK